MIGGPQLVLGSACLAALCFLVHSPLEALILLFVSSLLSILLISHIWSTVCPGVCSGGCTVGSTQFLLVHTWGFRAPLKDHTVTGVCKLGLSFGSTVFSSKEASGLFASNQFQVKWSRLRNSSRQRLLTPFSPGFCAWLLPLSHSSVAWDRMKQQAVGGQHPYSDPCSGPGPYCQSWCVAFEKGCLCLSLVLFGTKDCFSNLAQPHISGLLVSLDYRPQAEPLLAKSCPFNLCLQTR